MKLQQEFDLFENTRCTISIDRQGELCIDLEDDKTFLSKDESIALAHAIIAHFIKDQPK